MSDSPAPLVGLHHVTAIASDPHQNVDFYTRVLGLRLVKKTVNFDDPHTYHLYYGDEKGRPGTLLTFFAHSGARRGRIGGGQATVAAFRVPEGSIPFWSERLDDHRVQHEEAKVRPDGASLRLLDPDGLRLELVATPAADSLPYWQSGGVPAEAAVRDLYAVTLSEAEIEPSARLITETLMWEEAPDDLGRCRFGPPQEGLDTPIEIVAAPDRGQIGAGSVHHIALRVADDPQQLAWRERLVQAQLQVTQVMDRNYFHSIYFREPGGVLFEIATDVPGFTVDEPLDALGSTLCLPPFLESRRSEIEAALPPIDAPTPS